MSTPNSSTSNNAETNTNTTNANPTPPVQPQVVQVVVVEPNKKYGVTPGFKALVRGMGNRDAAARLLHLYWAQTSTQRRWTSIFATLSALCAAFSGPLADPSIYEVYLGSAAKTILGLEMASLFFGLIVIGIISYYPIYLLINKSEARLHEGILVAILLGGAIGSGLYLMERIFWDATPLVWYSICALVSLFMINTVLRGAAWGLWLASVMCYQSKAARIFYIFYGMLLPYLVVFPILMIIELYRVFAMNSTPMELYVTLGLGVVYLAMAINTARLGRKFRQTMVEGQSIDSENEGNSWASTPKTR